MKVYVCGGDYETGEGRLKLVEFKLVSPSRGDGYPYVASDEKHGRALLRLCSHHSHLYSFDTETKRFELVEIGTPHVGSPRVVEKQALADQVMRQVNAKQFTNL